MTQQSRLLSPQPTMHLSVSGPPPNCQSTRFDRPTVKNSPASGAALRPRDQSGPFQTQFLPRIAKSYVTYVPTKMEHIMRHLIFLVADDAFLDIGTSPQRIFSGQPSRVHWSRTHRLRNSQVESAVLPDIAPTGTEQNPRVFSAPRVRSTTTNDISERAFDSVLHKQTQKQITADCVSNRKESKKKTKSGSSSM